MPVAIDHTAASATSAAPSLTRKDAKPGDIFVVRGKTVKYAAVGQNGKLYSINLTTGEVASTANPNSHIDIVGHYTVGLTLWPAAKHFATTRNQIAPNQLFISGKYSPPPYTDKALYMSLGTLDNGQGISLNVGSRDHALCSINSNGPVIVVGTGKFVV